MDKIKKFKEYTELRFKIEALNQRNELKYKTREIIYQNLFWIILVLCSFFLFNIFLLKYPSIFEYSIQLAIVFIAIYFPLNIWFFSKQINKTKNLFKEFKKNNSILNKKIGKTECLLMFPKEKKFKNQIIKDDKFILDIYENKELLNIQEYNILMELLNEKVLCEPLESKMNYIYEEKENESNLEIE